MNSIAGRCLELKANLGLVGNSRMVGWVPHADKQKIMVAKGYEMDQDGRLIKVMVIALGDSQTAA